MALTTTGQSVDSANPIYKKRYEDISFSFAFPASDSVNWTGLTLTGQLRNDRDQLIWDSGDVTASITSGAGSATITIPSATTGGLSEGRYYVDFFYWSNTVGKTATPTYIIRLADGPTDL